MNKKVIFSLVIFCTMTAVITPVSAQWDLGNNSAVDSINSGGTGTLGVSGALGSPNSNNAGLSINQTYNAGSNAMRPNQAPTQYNQYGQVQNSAYGQAPQVLSVPSTRGLSYMQNGALPAGLKGTFNGLPPTSLDSFVKNAGGHAESIYGDEGTNSYPRLDNFSPINAGITGQRAKTLRTGHGGDRLPTASGDGVRKAP